MSYQPNERCDITYRLINELNDEGVIDAEKELFFVGRDSTLMYYQFMTLQYGFSTELPADNENILVFSEYDPEQISAWEKGWFYTCLDSNEYVYSTNKEMINWIEMKKEKYMNR